MDTQATRLRAARIAKGFASAREAARAVGVGESTYTHHENGTRGFGRVRAAKYARAFGVKASFLLMLADAGENSQHPTAELPVHLEAAVGVWREDGVDSMSQTAENLTVPGVVEWRADKEYAVQVRDRSVDRFILQGEWAVCKPIRPGPLDTSQLDVNDYVHIERKRRGLKEISIRRIRAKEGAQLRLSTHSSDPKIRHEVTFPAKGPHDVVIILGVVVGKYLRIKN